MIVYMELGEETPKAEYVPANEGDIAGLKRVRHKNWILIEVITVSKRHRRVTSGSDRVGKIFKVYPKDRPMVVSMDRLNKQRALNLLFDSPEVGFATLQDAAEYMRPALLRKGESTGDIEVKEDNG